MKLKFIASIFALLAYSLGANSQNIIIDATPTPIDLVTNTLIGPGLTTSNITFSGNPNQLGYFSENGSSLGLDSGIVMSSGDVTQIPTLGTLTTDYMGAGDPDVLATAQSINAGITSSNDAAILEFDFVPNGDVVTFRFVFASDEYYTWINSVYNDAFGFYISGANPLGGNYVSENVALVPGTTDPITISTIYDDPTQVPPQMNAQYFVPSFTGLGFNAGSIPVEVRFDVICDSTYHFKFAVADCQDGTLDTGIFLEGGSFQAIPVDLAIEPNVGSSQFGDSVIFEGCGTSADFIFSRPSCQSGDSLYVDVSIAGTATNGVDYALIPDSVLFLPGSTQVIFPFFAIQDGIPEGYESVIITVTNILLNGDTIVTTGTIWLLDNLNVEANALDTTILCMQDSVEIFVEGLNGVPPYLFVWEAIGDTLTDSSMFVPGTPNGSYDYYVTVVDACGYEHTDTLTLTVDQTLIVLSTTSGDASSCLADGWVSADVDDETEVLSGAFYHWEGPGVGGTYFADATTLPDVPSGWYYFSVQDDVCYVEDSVYVIGLDPPVANFTSSNPNGCSPLTVNFTNNSSPNSVSFEWDYGNGNIEIVNGMTGTQAVFYADATVTLTAYDAAGCENLIPTTLDINVEPCGCMDPTATNYNPLATVPDESCIYPDPTVIAPNIFTPNGDDINELFELDITNSVNVDLVILDRWGAVMFDESSLYPTWDGTTPNGTEAAEGTYFYKYVATGPGDGTNQTEGHGFVQLVRD